ncbi:MAG: sensor histidine kinase [Qipengyuania sp.]
MAQTLAILALALLTAQLVSGALLYRAAEQRRENALIHAAAFQLVAGPQRMARRDLAERRGERIGRLPRRLRYREEASSPLRPDEARHAEREAALAEILSHSGVSVQSVAVVERAISDDPVLARAARRFPGLRPHVERRPHNVLVVAMKQPDARLWQVARIPVPPRDSGVIGGLVLQTIVLFAVLMTLLWLALRRITRPLAALTERTERFSHRATPAEPLAPSGPDDIRSLILAHNAMEARIGAMLEEKDVMLGAIGHDLKTPLAALRVRIETIDDEAQRTKMAATITEIAHTLDEILDLARIGKDSSAAEPVELGALAASVVEEFEDLGEPVTLDHARRIVAPVHLTWLKRGLRNLVANALRYGGTARVTMSREDGWAVIGVEDEGPGIPADRIDAMLEPFVRGEASRNRSTGGAGLGLTIARAVAERHGGRLVLRNHPQGGLRAEIRLPL